MCACWLFPTFAGKMTFGEVIISAAIIADAQNPGNTAAAATQLASICHNLDLTPPANPHEFITTWAGRVDMDGHIDHKAQQAGRRATLTDAMIEAAYKAIINWEKEGRFNPYESQADLVANCPKVKTVLRRSGVHIGYLVRMIRATHPNFGRKKLRVRWNLTGANKEERLNTAEMLLAKPSTVLNQVVHFDAKTVYMEPEEIYG